MQKQKISLSMVVKNRVLVLERCLLSVLPMIDYWIICDTGSTDGTQDLIRAFFSKHKLPGELHERPWVSLGHNRTEALELARPHSDYVLIMDADDRLEYTDTFKRLHLAADSYTIESVRDGQSSFRTQLVKSNRPWRYEGMSHEFLSYWDEIQQKHVFPETTTQKHLPHVVMRRGADGEGRAETADSLFKGDAEIVRAAL